MNKRGELLRDLYGDLRDRRLLPVVIILLVAIVAVPFVLGGGGSEPLPPTPPSAASAGAGEGDELSPVVVADVPGLRDYRERLSSFNRRNPFTQQMTGSNTAQGGDGNLEQVGDPALDTSTGTTGTTGATAGASSSDPASPPPSDGGSTTDGGGSGDKGEDRLLVTTIDVEVTRDGKTKLLEGVKSLELVPGDKRPVVQFVNGGDDGTNAAFVVSPDVVETSGDGKCSPGRNDCRFVLMEVGHSRDFVYGAGLEEYRIKVVAIDQTTVPYSGADG